MRRLEPGAQLGRYKILKRLGAGAMGEVYLAEDPQIGRSVALKTVLVQEGRASELEERKRRLLREARAAGKLLHPNIVALFDASEDQEVLYLAFEFVEGKDLADRVHEGPELTLGEALSIVRQAAEGLDFAHRQGVVHRDIKPSNLMITADGRVKIADFGIARVADQTSDLTMTGSVVGSPHYMSPEQIRGEELDGRTDIFSLGVLLYEVLCKRRPFEGETLTTLVYQILNQEPTSIVVRRPDLGGRLEQIVRRMMHKDRAERFASAAEVAREIAACERELSPEQLAGAALGDEDSQGMTRRLDSSAPTASAVRPAAPAAPPPPPPRAAVAAPPPPPPSYGPAAAAPKGGKSKLWLVAAIVVVVLGGLVAAGLAARRFVAERLKAKATQVANQVANEIATPPATTVATTTPATTTPATTTPATTTDAPPVANDPAPVTPVAPITTMPDPGTRATVPVTTTPARVEPEPTPARTEPEPVRETPRREPVRSPVRPPEPTPQEPPPAEPEPEPDPRAAREDLIARLPVQREMSTGMNLSFDVQPKDAAEQVIVKLDRTVIGRASEWNAKKRDGRSYTVADEGLHIVSFVLDGNEVYRIRIDARAGGQNPTTIAVNLGGGPPGRRRGGGNRD